jgi:hypothetical protein
MKNIEIDYDLFIEIKQLIESASCDYYTEQFRNKIKPIFLKLEYILREYYYESTNTLL